MSSTLTWLDYSDRDRQRALDVVDLLRESSTVDELGLGLVRDAFAGLLFPGTSTIQTRARYFLFIPWIYRELERLRVPSHQAESRARKAEIALIEALAATGETGGVIGIQARKTLKRLPSNVYWNGLLSWGIRKFPGTHPQYHQSLDGFYLSPRGTLVDDDNNPSAGAPLTNWDLNLPAVPTDFPDGATLSLRRLEAEWPCTTRRIGARSPAPSWLHGRKSRPVSRWKMPSSSFTTWRIRVENCFKTTELSRLRWAPTTPMKNLLIGAGIAAVFSFLGGWILMKLQARSTEDLALRLRALEKQEPALLSLGRRLYDFQVHDYLADLEVPAVDVQEWVEAWKKAAVDLGEIVDEWLAEHAPIVVDQEVQKAMEALRGLLNDLAEALEERQADPTDQSKLERLRSTGVWMLWGSAATGWTVDHARRFRPGSRPWWPRRQPALPPKPGLHTAIGEVLRQLRGQIEVADWKKITWEDDHPV